MTQRDMMSSMTAWYHFLKPFQIPIGVLFGFSTIVLIINALFFQFPGNCFGCSNVLPVFVFLFVNLLFLLRVLNIQMMTQRIVQECILLFMVWALIIYGATAVQYTPFSPIDDHILALENALHIPLLPLVIWTKHHPLLNSFLEHIYNLLDLEIIALPFYALALKQYQSLHRYFFLVLITSFMGMAFYYFFPTTGPASHFPSAYFSPVQRATGIKFIEIHHHLQPSTALGGMIAMPSFHVIWAWLNVYLVRFQRALFLLLGVINLLLTGACVLLGWHYVLDLIGSFLVLATAFYMMKRNFIVHGSAHHHAIHA